MAKKSKKSSKKTRSSVKRSSHRKSTKSSKSSGKIVTQKKYKLIISNLVLFAVLFVISVILYYSSKAYFNEIIQNTFWMSSLITGFLTVTFVIIYLIFFFLKRMGK